MQPLLTVPLSWQGAMHFHYRDSKVTVAIIAISILLLGTSNDALCGNCSTRVVGHFCNSSVIHTSINGRLQMHSCTSIIFACNNFGDLNFGDHTL